MLFNAFTGWKTATVSSWTPMGPTVWTQFYLMFWGMEKERNAVESQSLFQPAY